MIIRTIKNKNYTTINNTVLEDVRLSWEAKGLATYLLSKPDDWRIKTTQLWHASANGIQAVKRILRELEAAGYLQRERSRDPQTGKFVWMQILYEIPLPVETVPPAEGETSIGRKPSHGQPSDGKPSDGNPYYGEPCDGFPSDIVSTDIPNTDIPSTEVINPEPSSPDPSSKATKQDDGDEVSSPDEWRQVTALMHRCGITLSGYMSEQYQDMLREYGVLAVLAGIKNAADNGKAGRLKYVRACVANAAAGYHPNGDGKTKTTISDIVVIGGDL